MIRRVHVIACAVLAIDLKEVARNLDAEVSLEFLPAGLHDSPSDLRDRLQTAIDDASAAGKGDMIAIGYGVCGRGTIGLHARHVPLAIPRVHDCIALMLGSDAAYRKQFRQYPGTYYVSAGWVNEKTVPLTMAEPAQGGAGGCGRLHEVVEQMDDEDAAVVNDFMTSWQRNYQRAAFIDTGVDSPNKQRYDQIARDMADRFDWKYEKLQGSPALLEQVLTTGESTDEILVVPPHHVTSYDPVGRGLAAVPIWQTEDPACQNAPHTLVFDDSRETNAGDHGQDRAVEFGLGIDAGGTYTDAVIFDFSNRQILGKAKAQTTHWQYTEGINAALDQLDATLLAKVELVSLSTTLATNAIVEGKGQAVGLLLMPPPGRFDATETDHHPTTVIPGRLNIAGEEQEPIDLDAVRAAAQRMIDRHHVRAFAVTGYASCINPAHEMAVREALRQTFDLPVTCGHDVSETLNYRVRAQTAALNARIIPCLDSLLTDVNQSLARRSIDAPVMVVRSDGALMSTAAALEKPVMTILSGPAASVAGARYITESDEAVVVDIGGTTTDLAIIERGQPRTCADGAIVGRFRTHVPALDMRTLGLGGDSRIALTRRKLTIGPDRVTPIANLAHNHPGASEAIDYLPRFFDHFDAAPQLMDVLFRTRRPIGGELSSVERQMLDLLAERPHSVHEIGRRLFNDPRRSLPLQSLEREHLIHRAALTPTDLLHVRGDLKLWPHSPARKLAALFAELAGRDLDEFVRFVLDRFIDRLATQLLKVQIPDLPDDDSHDDSPLAAALLRTWLTGDARSVGIDIHSRRTIVGIGAPADFFVPDAARKLNASPAACPNADVANAIGAITSNVVVRHHATIEPADDGRYHVHGLTDAPSFGEFHEAHRFAADSLVGMVRNTAHAAGTSNRRVEMHITDHIAPLGDGGQLFVKRSLEARVQGAPDLARMRAAM